MTEWYGWEPEETQSTQSPKEVKPKAEPPPEPEVVKIEKLFVNQYRHCGAEWEDTDEQVAEGKCFVCGCDVTPYRSEEIV